MAKKNKRPEGKLPRSVVRKAWAYNLVFRAGSGYTYSMGAREASTMGIVLSHLYENKEDVGRELEKYYRYYNTNIPFDGMIAGLVINMEEQRAEDPSTVSPQAIQAVQTGLMGPVGNVGDVIVQAIAIPLLLSVGIAMSGDPNDPHIIGPLFSLITISLFVPLISYFVWMKTYDFGRGLLSKILEGGLTETLLKAANVLGCMTMGALIAKYVNVTTSIAWIDEAADASFILQTDLFDALVPNLLSLLAVLMFLRFLKKGIKAQTLIWLTMAASIVLSLLGILGTPPTIG